MRNPHGQAMEYLIGATVQLQHGRHESADELLRQAWRVFGNGSSMETASPDDLRRFGVMARVAGVGATPDSALERVRDAIAR